MTASPQPQFPARSRPAVQLMAFVGDATGAAPTLMTDAAPWLIPIEQHETSGAAFNQLTFQIDLDRLGDRYQDILVPEAVDRTVELRELRKGTADTLRGWAKLATNAIGLTDRQESSTITCRLDDTALELRLLQFATYYDGPSTAEVQVEQDWVFNPTDRTNVRGNRSDETDANGVSYFLSPGSVRSQQSLTLQAQNPKRWTLAQAVHALCWHCNPDETRLTNPDLTDLQAVLDNAERDAQFLNHRIPRGTTFLAALDMLLRPYSCAFNLEWSGVLGSVETKLKVYVLGEGTTESIRSQRIGDTITAAKTDSVDIQMAFDITANPNRLLAVSSRKQWEVTLKLFPAWDSAFDPLPDSEYFDGFEHLGRDPEFKEDGKYAHVGRTWCANEAGDYIGFRTSTASAQQIAGTDRLVCRPLLPCLTRGPNGDLIGNNGYYLEWQDAADVWREVKSGYEVLTDEAGIRFTGVPPIDLWNEFEADRENFYLRITATVELDLFEKYETPRRSDSPQGQEHWMLLDLSERFAERRLCDAGDQKSRFYDDRTTTLVSAAQNTSSGDWELTLAHNVDEKLRPGQKLALLDSTRENVYTVKIIAGVKVTVEEDASVIVGATASGDRVYLNTDGEGCTERLKAAATKARDDNDFALVTPQIELLGIDHPQYEIGKLIPDAQPRNVAFAGRRGGTRAPQITGKHYRFYGQQRTTLLLEQFVGATVSGGTGADAGGSASFFLSKTHESYMQRQAARREQHAGLKQKIRDYNWS